MPTLLGPAIDPTLAGPALTFVEAFTLTEPIPPAPVPTDPDVEWEGPNGTAIPLVQVVLGQAITRDVIGELVTAKVSGWCDDVELLAGSTGSITASTFDPLWAACADTVSMGVDGLPKYTFDPAGFVVWIYVDMACVWTGRFSQPVEIGGGVVGLPAQGPQSVFDQRILGRAEQPDLLGDRGSFEGYANEAAMVADGWRFPAGMEYELVADGVRGVQCLRVRGDGWFASPKVTVDGGDISKAVQGATFGKWSDVFPSGSPVVRTRVQRSDLLGPSNEDIGFANMGGRPDSGEQWSESPVESATRTTPDPITHRVWVEGRGIEGHWSFYDLMTVRESVQTGFPPGAERDLAYYIERIHQALVSLSLGGSPTGLITSIVSLTGVETSQRWEHAQRASAREVFAAVIEAEGGPECRVTPGWTLEIHARLGADRQDIALSVHDVLDPAWRIDPGARVHDFVVDTGRGSGASWISATVSTPYRPDEWRNVAIVNGPVDRTFNEIESWARAHARAAARLQVTTEVDVPWHVAQQIDPGDQLWVMLHDGDAGVVHWMRVLRIGWNPDRLTATVSLGAGDE